MEGGVTVIVAGEQQLAIYLGLGDLVELAGFSRGVDDGEAGFAGDDEVVMGQEFCRDLPQLTGNCGGMENRVTRIGLLHERCGGYQCRWYLGKVAVERGDMKYGFATDIFGQQILRREIIRWHLIQSAGFSRFVEQGITEVGLAQDGLRGDQPGGELGEMAVGRRNMKDGVAGIATIVKQFGGELLIDDEQPLLDVFSAALGTQFEVTTANNVREAEFILHKKTFKVVVADHLMPGGNGMSFLVRAREEYPHMQRILVTGYMKPEILLRSVNEAALFRYLLKPVSMAELLKVVRDAAKMHDVSVAMASA